MTEKIYTNGAYVIKATLSKERNKKDRTLKGIIIKSKYPFIYDIGDKIDFHLYNTNNSKEPQFKLELNELRKAKLNRILKFNERIP